MKKLGILALMFSLSLCIFAGPFTVKDIPRDVEREIFDSFSGSGEDRRRNIEDAKEAYIRLQNKAYDSDIPKEDLEVIIVRLHQMYGTNFQKQSGEFDREVAQYKDMVRRVEEKVKAETQKVELENQKAKKEIEVLSHNHGMSQALYQTVLKRAAEKYPNNFVAQRYFIEGAIEFSKIKK